jgi:hypothetical protein
VSLEITQLQIQHAAAMRAEKFKEAERIRAILLERHQIGHRWLSKQVIVWDCPNTTKKVGKKK